MLKETTVTGISWETEIGWDEPVLDSVLTHYVLDKPAMVISPETAWRGCFVG